MKTTLLIITTIALSIRCGFADPVLVNVKATPYDRQMSRIRGVLASSGSRGGGGVSLLVVNHWIDELHEIPYRYHYNWQKPGEVRFNTGADCKGKALTLYRRMKAHGATDVRLVIGWRTPWSRSTHAWLEWKTARGRFVLDPTFQSAATRATELEGFTYVPLYAYAGGRKFRVASR